MVIGKKRRAQKNLDERGKKKKTSKKKPLGY